MKNLFHFILLLTFLHGFSQNSEDRNVFKTIIEFEKDSSFVYCEKSEGYLSLLKTISNKKLYNPFISSNKLILSLKEIKFLKNEIKKHSKYLFQPNLLKNATIISPDTLIFYSKNREKNYRKQMNAVFDTQDSLKIKKFRNENGINYDWVHFFSKPIYFRNNSFCILYYAKLCNFNSGLGGCSQIIICRKNKNKWEKFNEITNGCY